MQMQFFWLNLSNRIKAYLKCVNLSITGGYKTNEGAGEVGPKRGGEGRGVTGAGGGGGAGTSQDNICMTQECVRTGEWWSPSQVREQEQEQEQEQQSGVAVCQSRRFYHFTNVFSLYPASLHFDLLKS